jgi:hypothetical protein
MVVKQLQYSNPTEINKGELAEPVHLSTVRMLEDSNAQSALQCSALEAVLINHIGAIP